MNEQNEMPPLFECHALMNRQNLKEAIKRIARPIMKILIVCPLFAVAAILMFVLYFTGGETFELLIAIFTTVFAITFPIIILVANSKAANSQYISFLEQNNNIEPALIIRFYNEGIIVFVSSENKTRLSYQIWKRVTITTNLILISAKQTFITLERSKFSIGNEQELIAFLGGKGIVKK